MIDSSIPAIKIKPRFGKRAKGGHPWIFSNEVQHPEPQLSPGTLVSVIDDGGNFLGYATYNPHGLISLRLLSREPEIVPGSVEWFQGKIQTALNLRRKLFPDRRSYRLIYADSDGLPGVVVDRYEDYLAAQILTAGMERLLQPLVEALKATLKPNGIVLRNTGEKRKLEALPLYTKVIYGEVPDRIAIEENGVRLWVDSKEGQKTGHFFDQAENRLALSAYANGAEALDLFCHAGAWALKLLAAGAKHAVAVDSAAPAIALAGENARLNGFENRLECVEADAFAWLADARREKRRFDLVVVDPPAFAKSAPQAKKALRGYEDVNRQAIHLLRDGGILCTCSCSSYIGEDQFLNVLSHASARERRNVRILEIRGQSKDHPILLAMPESRYLKCVIGVVMEY